MFWNSDTQPPEKNMWQWKHNNVEERVKGMNRSVHVAILHTIEVWEM